MDRALAVDEILLLLERLAGDAVPAFVEPFVDVARGVIAPDELLHAGLVARLGRADEVVERDVELLPDVAELLLHAVAVRQRILALLPRLAKDVLRVLVVAHHETDVEPGQPLVARDDVGGNLLVRRPEVRPAVDVVDRGRQIEAASHRVH